jgi:hypothetical protein
MKGNMGQISLPVKGCSAVMANRSNATSVLMSGSRREALLSPEPNLPPE